MERQAQYPVYIGGTGRSGTTVVGKLFRHHPDVLVFFEPNFINSHLRSKGVQGMYRGKTTVKKFLDDWQVGTLPKLAYNHERYNKLSQDPAKRVYSQQEISDLTQELFPDGEITPDRIRALLLELYRRGLEVYDKPFWVEKTPYAFRSLDMLFDLFPDTRFIHVMRDPKNIASSIIGKDWGPTDVDTFIPWYKGIMTKGLEMYRVLPPGQVITVCLETLVRMPKPLIKYMFEFAGFRVTEEAVESARAELDPARVLNNRWVYNLSVEDAIRIEQECMPIHNLWLQLSLG